MTIQGALADLNNLLKADDIPFYYEGSIKKVIETIEMEFEDKELEQKESVIQALEDVKATIHEVGVLDSEGDLTVAFAYANAEVIVDRKIKEVREHGISN